MKPLYRKPPQTVKEYRHAFQVTQVEMSELLGVSLSTVKNWESGRVSVPKYLIMCLEMYYNYYGLDKIHLRKPNRSNPLKKW